MHISYGDILEIVTSFLVSVYVFQVSTDCGLFARTILQVFMCLLSSSPHCHQYDAIPLWELFRNFTRGHSPSVTAHLIVVVDSYSVIRRRRRRLQFF